MRVPFSVGSLTIKSICEHGSEQHRIIGAYHVLVHIHALQHRSQKHLRCTEINLFTRILLGEFKFGIYIVLFTHWLDIKWKKHLCLHTHTRTHRFVGYTQTERVSNLFRRSNSG